MSGHSVKQLRLDVATMGHRVTARQGFAAVFHCVFLATNPVFISCSALACSREQFTKVRRTPFFLKKTLDPLSISYSTLLAMEESRRLLGARKLDLTYVNVLLEGGSGMDWAAYYLYLESQYCRTALTPNMDRQAR